MFRWFLVTAALLLSIESTSAIDLKLPWPSGESWQVTVGYNGYCISEGCPDEYHTDANNGYYALDFDDPNAAPGSGRPILAAASGTVDFAGGDPSVGFGYYVKINHGNGYVTLYGHLKEWPMVATNDVVFQGQQIGKLGNTGWSTADHLHFQLFYEGQCLSTVPNSKPEPISNYTNIVYGQSLISDNTTPVYNVVWQEQYPVYEPGKDALYLVVNETVACGLKVLNNSNVPLSNDGNSEWYVELHSTNSNYNQDATSPLSASNWLTSTHIVSSNTTANPGQPTWYYFNIHTPSTPGTYWLYMRLYRPHNGYGFLGPTGWNIKVQVVDPDQPPTGVEYYALSGNWNGNYRTDIGLFTPSGGQWFVAFSDGTNHFVGQPRWLNNFGVAGDPSGPSKPLVGDFNGDNKDDIAVYQCYAGKWFVALSNGSSFDNSSSLWLPSFAVGNPGAWKPLVGDFNGDNKDDICAYEPSSGQWWVALSTGSSFSSNGCWRYTFGVGSGYVPLIGDFNSDNRYDICVLEQSTGKWFVATSTGSSFYYQGSPWLTGFGVGTGYKPVVRDFDNDGRDDVCAYEPSSGQWWVALSTGSSFSSNGCWRYTFGVGSGYVPFTGDFDYNSTGRGDVAVYEPSTGKWFVALSTGTSFAYPGTYWLNNWGVGTAGSGKILAETEQLLPTDFKLSQNYPNPFNPVTTISYSLPEATRVTLDIFNILGQKVETLVDERQEAGKHSISWDARKQASGIYFYRLKMDQVVETKKMVLLK